MNSDNVYCRVLAEVLSKLSQVLIASQSYEFSDTLPPTKLLRVTFTYIWIVTDLVSINISDFVFFHNEC